MNPMARDLNRSDLADLKSVIVVRPLLTFNPKVNVRDAMRSQASS